MTGKKELVIVILLCIILISIWKVYYDSYEKKYTIGQVVDKQTGMKSGTVAMFEFFYKNKKMEGGTGIGDYSVKVGEKYIVEFAKDKVNLSKALFYHPVPDTIEMDIPADGWTKIPDKLRPYRRKRTEDINIRKPIKIHYLRFSPKEGSGIEIIEPIYNE